MWVEVHKLEYIRLIERLKVFCLLWQLNTRLLTPSPPQKNEQEGCTKCCWLGNHKREQILVKLQLGCFWREVIPIHAGSMKWNQKHTGAVSSYGGVYTFIASRRKYAQSYHMHSYRHSHLLPNLSTTVWPCTSLWHLPVPSTPHWAHIKRHSDPQERLIMKPSLTLFNQLVQGLPDSLLRTISDSGTPLVIRPSLIHFT